jgi:hypothetical protein
VELEVLSRTPVERRHETPLLLVHGAWHGAWCWDGGFMDRLAGAGFEVHALSLRGHGGSPGRSQLRRHSTTDYVEDVATVVESLGTAPLLVGHSMGGWVVQHYLKDHQAAGAVLVASVPVTGTARFSARIARGYPGHFARFVLTASAWPVVETPELARHWFFSDAYPDEALHRHHAQLQDESFRAALDMLLLRRPDPAAVSCPMLVLAGEGDRIFSVAEEERTARAYGVEAEIFPGMAHNMMSDPGWEAVADRIASWAGSVAG